MLACHFLGSWKPVFCLVLPHLPRYHLVFCHQVPSDLGPSRETAAMSCMSGLSLCVLLSYPVLASSGFWHVKLSIIAWRSTGDIALALLIMGCGEATELGRATDTGTLCRDVLWRETWQSLQESFAGMRELDPACVSNVKSE